MRDVIVALIRHLLLSALVLGNAALLSIIGIVTYAKVTFGGHGVSASEYLVNFLPMIARAMTLGVAALAAVGLYWMMGLALVPTLRCEGGAGRAMKISVVLIPLAFALLYVALTVPNLDSTTLRGPMNGG